VHTLFHKYFFKIRVEDGNTSKLVVLSEITANFVINFFEAPFLFIFLARVLTIKLMYSIRVKCFGLFLRSHQKALIVKPKLL